MKYPSQFEKGETLDQDKGLTGSSGSSAEVRLLVGQHRLFEMIANGTPLPDVLNLLALTVEDLANGTVCSIWLVDKAGTKLRQGAAPSLPESYKQAMDGLAIGSRAGSCGTAAYFRRPVIVPDIASDPLWTDYRDLALSHQLRACWSMPILLSSGDLLGTLAVYDRTPRTPNENELRIIKLATQIAGIAIERKRAKEALKENEERYKSLFENVPIGIYRTTPDGRILLANPSLVHMLGCSSPDELLSRNLETEGFSPAYPRSRFKELIEREGEVKGLEAAWTRRDGVVIFVRENAKVIRKDDGTTLYYEGTVEDITEREQAESKLRESEQRYHLLFERSFSGIYRSTLDGCILDCNEAFARILGYDSREEILAAGAAKLYFNPAERKDFLACLQKRRILTNFEHRLLRKDGNSVWVLENVNLSEGEAGAMPLLEGVLIDITERKETEKRLEKAYEQLRSLSTHLQLVREEERTRISRELHDELGQALTGLKLDLAWLRDGLHEDQRSLLTKIEAMSNLIDDTILTVQRISSEMRPRILDDLGLAAAIEWQVQEFQNRTEIECIFTSPPKDITLGHDRSTAVFRIFQEALTNVARHAAASKALIRLSEKAGYFLLEVKDNGKGVAKSKIFDSKSLGFIGMRERALLWGGQIEIKGIRGKGTTVTVRMPVRREVDRSRAQ
ncbi:MAG: PAS domain S-box protein [Blastocatellia bacterium]|nr:PAS domain S-box protein [Blastocatellia bacterium]